MYKFPFSTTDKYTLIREAGTRVALLRSDLPDPQKFSVLKDMFDLPNFGIETKNVGANKPNTSGAYSEFLQSVCLPKDYISRMLDSKFARHFFNSEERQRLFRRWCRGS